MHCPLYFSSQATTRRGVPSVNQTFGNKLAILGGDFLLSRASVFLARLRNVEVVELLSTVIEHLVKGEVMQMRPSSTGKSALEYYLRKNFYKTASLMGHSCLAAAVLGKYHHAWH
jgi:geranylgeranyl pyrophosphate synthase